MRARGEERPPIPGPSAPERVADPRPSRRYTSERDALAVFRRVQEELEREEAAHPPAPEPAPAPRPVVAAATVAPAPAETVDLIRRLASPCGPEAVEAAARRLATRLGDEHSVGYYRGICEAVRAGRVPVKTVVGAFKQASGGTARCPGSVFVGFVREHSPPGSAQRPTPGATQQSPPGAGIGTNAPQCPIVQEARPHVHRDTRNS